MQLDNLDKCLYIISFCDDILIDIIPTLECIFRSFPEVFLEVFRKDSVCANPSRNRVSQNLGTLFNLNHSMITDELNIS